VLVELREILEDERPPDTSLLPKDKWEVKKFQENHLASLYVRYLIIYHKLEDYYDQVLQPQKRQDIKLILERVIGRILEIRRSIIELSGEFVDMDEVLVDLKQTPEVLEIRIPRYFKEENEKEMKRREILIDLLMRRHNIDDTINLWDSFEEEKPLAPMTLQQAILIIQTNERGRQGRQSAKFKKELKQREERVRRVVELGEMYIDRDGAATMVQKLWKGYQARKLTKEMKREEAEFLGMAYKSTSEYLEFERNMTKKLESTKARRKLIQKENIKDLNEETVNMRMQIVKEEGPKMMEDMHDAILEQVVLYRQDNPENTKSGIPNFPSEADGGSKAFMQNIASLPPEAIPKKKEETKDSKPPQRSASRTGTPKPQPDPRVKLQPEEPETTQFDIPEAIQLFLERWTDKENNPFNFYQKFDSEMLRQKLMRGVDGIEEELRKQVDDKIRQELNNLKLQIEAETKTRNPKQRKKPPQRPPKPIPEKKSIEPFLNELVSLGIVKKVPKLKISNYLGCHHILGGLLEGWDQPSMGQVRQTISEITLSLGSEEIHKKIAPNIKSILLFGPEKTGKTMLTYAMAHETNATLFDLSPKNIIGKNEGAKETSNMIKMVFEVARNMQPAIIYIDDFDYVIKGKGKGKAKKGGVRLKKELLVQHKTLQPGERILIVANSREPWDADQELWEKFFDRMINTVLPDYASYQEIWAKLVRARMEWFRESKSSKDPSSTLHPSGLPDNFDLHTLCLLSRSGYSSGSVAKIVRQVLSERRLKRLHNQPLTAEEFIAPLSRTDPVYKKVDLKYRQFVSKVGPNKRKRNQEDIQKLQDQIAEEKKKQQTVVKRKR